MLINTHTHAQQSASTRTCTSCDKATKKMTKKQNQLIAQQHAVHQHIHAQAMNQKTM